MPDSLSNQQQRGFTLIELVITVAIIGILAAVAWPMFEQQSLKKNRTVAMAALTTASAELERCFLNQSTYVGCPFTNSSDRNLYTIAATLSTESFALTATPNVTPDPECATLTLTNTGQQGFTGTGTLQRCWSK